MKPQVFRADELVENDFGSVQVASILDTEEVPELSINRVRVVGVQKSGIDKVNDIAYYVLEGEGKFYINDEEFDVKKGDMVFIPKGNKYKDTAGLTLLAISNPRYSRDHRVRFEK